MLCIAVWARGLVDPATAFWLADGCLLTALGKGGRVRRGLSGVDRRSGRPGSMVN